MKPFWLMFVPLVIALGITGCGGANTTATIPSSPFAGQQTGVFGENSSKAAEFNISIGSEGGIVGSTTTATEPPFSAGDQIIGRIQNNGDLQITVTTDQHSSLQLTGHVSFSENDKSPDTISGSLISLDGCFGISWTPQ